MRRLRFILCGLAAAVLAVSPAFSASQPNVLLIISDDQAWTDYSFMGHPFIRTPQLDRLASQSLNFRHGYVPSSLCSPSLASIVTGLYPHQHGITSNDPPLPEHLHGRGLGVALRDSEFVRRRHEMISQIDRSPSLPRTLREAGYLSLQTGKWWLGNYARGGFTHGMTHGDESRGGRHGDEGLKIGREGLDPIYSFIDEAQREQKPFFVWYAPFLPHAPHTPPERFLAMYRTQAPSPSIARYWAMCSWLDETCGELLDFLDRRELANDTLVIFVADNGWIQDPERPQYAPRSKQSQYDGGLRTPILIRWPGRVAPAVIDTPVSSVDIAPTILRAAGLAPDEEMAGVDLLDWEAVRGREAVFGEIFTHNAVRMEEPASSLRFRWVLREGWKLIWPEANEPEADPELYFLPADPYEKQNLSPAYPERVRELKARLDAWWTP